MESEFIIDGKLVKITRDADYNITSISHKGNTLNSHSFKIKDDEIARLLAKMYIEKYYRKKDLDKYFN